MTFRTAMIPASLMLAAAALAAPAHGATCDELVLNACDALDGVKDGVLENPMQCHFDPKAIQC